MRVLSGMTAATRRADPRLGVAASLVAVAFVTGVIALLKGFVPVLSLGALYVFAVLPIAIAWGLLFAVGVSAASMSFSISSFCRQFTRSR